MLKKIMTPVVILHEIADKCDRNRRPIKAPIMPDAAYDTQVPTDKVFSKVTYHVRKSFKECIEQKL